MLKAIRTLYDRITGHGVSFFEPKEPKKKPKEPVDIVTFIEPTLSPSEAFKKAKDLDSFIKLTRKNNE